METTEISSLGQTGSEQELSHSDKMIGIITAPSETFEKMAKFPPKTMDWFLPVLILCIVIAITQILVMTNPDIAYQAKQKQMEAIQKNFDEAVAKGQMTQEQANEQMDQIEERMAAGGAITYVFQTIGIFLFVFIFFFILCGIYFLLSKFALKGDGVYASALVANGLTSYIGIIHVILASVFAFAFGRLMRDISLASLLDMDKSSIVGWLSAKVDPLSIWAYVVLSIGLAKMFKSQTITKYYVLVFGLWIVGGLVIWFIGKSVPFLSFLNM
ncbi:MAG: YIP1 family protein [Ignavibacteriaceae bacterium]|nr:YIP1 family protein [Ignavibacteriaceae bacterium]